MFFFKNFAMANYEKIFFDHSIKSIDDKIINLNEYKNKAVLLVNVASYCGFTKQYAELQQLWDKYKKSGLIVIPGRLPIVININVATLSLLAVHP